MKEHEDDLLPSRVKEPAVIVESTTADETVTEKLGGGEGKIEGFSGEGDGGEDMMVDVVGVDGHGGNLKVQQGLMKTPEVIMEDLGGLGGVIRDDSIKSRVLALEKYEVVRSEEGVGRSVEVSKEVCQDNVVATVTEELNADAQKPGDMIGVGESEMVVKSSGGEPQAVGGGIDVIDGESESRRGLIEEIVLRPVESAQGVADGDHVMEKTQKEAEVLDSSKTSESESLTMTANPGTGEVTEVAVQEVLVGKDEALDSVSVVPSLAHRDNRSSSGMDEGSVHVKTENSHQQAEIDVMSKEESGHPTVGVVKSDVGQQPVNIKPSDESVESHATLAGGLISSPDTILPSVGGGVEQVEGKFSSHSTLEASGEQEHHLSANIAHSEVARAIGLKVSDTGSSEHICASVENLSVVEIEESTVKTLDESSKTDVTIEVKEVATCSEVKEAATTISKVPDTEVQVPSSSGIDNVVENPGLKADSMTESSEANIAASAELGPSNDQKVPAPVNEITKGDDDFQNCKADFLNAGDMSGSAEGQGLTAKAVNVNAKFNAAVYPVGKPSDDDILLGSGNKVTAVHKDVPKSEAEVPTTGEMNGFQVSTEEFSFHVDKGEDAGMDIDELLGWKDEMPGTDALNDSREADPEFRKPIVYERRAHVEVPFYDAFEGRPTQELKDEDLQIETLNGDSDEDDKSVQEEEQTIAVHSTDLPTVEDTTNDGPSTSAHLDTMDGGKHHLEAHLHDGKDVSAADKETEAVEHSSEAERSTCIDEDISEPPKNAGHSTSVSLHQACYFQPLENEGDFSVTDLVWGKVRSHPWWPGQIFDPSDASKTAMKYHKKNRFLVAYFGDRTFAWNDSTVLKPFRTTFHQMEKNHSNSEAFRNAVSCAVEEVSRRVKLGLACFCISQDVYEKIGCQIVENAGIRQESSRRYGVDSSTGVNSFEPDKLVDYVRLLAQSPCDEDDKVDLAITKAQLSAYGCYKGHRQLPEFQFCGELLEDTADDVSVLGENRVDRVDGNVASDSVLTSSVKKRKALDSISNGSVKRQKLHPEKLDITPTSKPSFKVGECIQRVASQLTGAPSVSKSNNADHPAGSTLSGQSLENSVSGDQASLADMLSQLQLAAQNPMKGYSFLNSIVPFFSSYRSFNWSKSIRPFLSPGVGSARKRKTPDENDPEGFEFDDVNDSYWTDRIVQNHSEEPLLQDNQNGGDECQIVTSEPDKPVKPRRRSNKKRPLDSNHEIEAEEDSELDELRRQNLATEVIMKFAEVGYFTSEMNLNKMFRRFGPLMESETEVNRQSGRARVVFKRCSDAEVALSSAENFNIFGSINVKYELNYTPLVSYKPLPLPVFQGP